MEEITITTLVYLARIIVLFFALMYTYVFVRNIAIIAGRQAAGDDWSMKGSHVYIPCLLWTVFYILVQAPTFPMG